MDEQAALRVIAGAVAGQRVAFTYHALNESMPQRGLSVQDVLDALSTATTALAQDEVGAKWKVYGSLANGEDLAVVVRIKDRLVVLVVTAHNPP